MSNQPLKGHNVAVVTESEFIPSEIQTYQDKFAEYGAELHITTRLWPTDEQREAGEIDPAKFPPFTAHSDITPDSPEQFLEITEDFRTLNLDEFSAVIMSANYTSCRLRWFDNNDLAISNQGAMAGVRTAPTVQFFLEAMRRPGLVKGFLCHGLWILTPVPEVLTGRHVTCHRVVMADVINAGGIVEENKETGIVVDDDVVTSDSGGKAAAFVDAIKDQILAFTAE